MKYLLLVISLICISASAQTTPFINGGITRFVNTGTTPFVQSNSVSFTATNVTLGLQLDLYFDNNANDSSPNGYTGSFTGAAYGTAQNGTANFASSFDGTGGGFYTVGSPSLFSVTTQDFSTSDWVYVNSFANSQWVYSVGGGFSVDGYILALGSDGQIVFFSNQSGAQQTARSPVGAITASSWHNIILVRTGSTVAIYIDGVSMSVSYPDGTLQNPAAATTYGLYVGVNAASPLTQNFFGRIDDHRMFNRALNATEALNVNGYGARN